MVNGSSGSQDRFRRFRREVVLCALLVAAFWIVRYWYSSRFGLYEDDFTHLFAAASLTFREALAFAFDPSRIATLAGQGHPLHYTFMYLLANLGWSLAGIQGAYVVGFAVEAVNIVLLVTLFRGIHGFALATLGGLAYILYSADTTQAYLTFSLGLQPSLTLMLVSCHAYLSRRRWLAYPTAFLILLTYETTYPVCFAFPLLSPSPSDRSRRQVLQHVAILGALMAAVIIWRITAGDDRVSGLSLSEALLTPFVHVAQGTLVNLGTFLYRPYQVLRGLQADVIVLTLLATAAAAFVMSRLPLDTPEAVRQYILRNRISTSRPRRRADLALTWASIPPPIRDLARLALGGILMLALAYPLTYTVRAYAISGRDTRVHAAGVLGASLLVAALLLAALWFAESLRRRRVIAFAVAAWLGLLSGYGFLIQRDYIRAWDLQRSFWSELLPFLPDLDDGTVILVDPDGLEDPRQIGANYWNLPLILNQLYRFPDDWESPPAVYRLADTWSHFIMTPGGTLVIDDTSVFAPPSTYRKVDAEDAILIETRGDHFAREGSILLGQGGRVPIRELPPKWSEPPFPAGPLYRFMVNE